MKSNADHSLGRATRLIVYAFFLLSGVSALTYEIVWTRQLTLIAGATTPAVSTVLAVFMGGLALGAWLFGPIADRSRALLRWYGGLELGIALFALAQPCLLHWTGRFYVNLAPAIGHHGLGLLGLRIAISALLLVVPTTLMGGTLPLLVKFVSRREERFGWDLGTLYSVNLAGAVLGSALTGFVFIRALGINGTLGVAVFMNLSIGLAALWMSRAVVSPPPSSRIEKRTRNSSP
ncbi:MAG: fused MFS/spermidine synthase, partial [Verrucomicrobia bacterium]|nr:fused MFS/spermidine synthase [Verrucomicrobiota bacterium]